MQATVRIIIIILLLCIGLISAIQYELNPSPPIYANPDQYGYRVCASWELADGTPIYSGCDPFETTRCGEKFGFERSEISLGGEDNPCGKLIPQFEDCPSIIEGLGFSKFASYLRNVPQLMQKNGQPYTIFVPLPKNGGNLDNIYGSNPDAVSYHVAKGRYYADDLTTGVTLKSVYNNEDMYISRSSYGPLVPRSGLGNLQKTSIMDLLRTNPDTAEFAKDLPVQLQQDLSRVSSGQFYTITAPTSAAWTQIRGRYSKEQLESIAASHVSLGLKCTSKLIKSTQSLTVSLGESITVTCDIDDNTKREVRTIVDGCGQKHEFIDEECDMMAGNGVVHVLKDPIIPLASLTLKDFMDRPECAKYQNIDEFVDVLKECDLYMNDVDQYAIIAPTNSAFDWWKNYAQFRSEYDRFQVDADYRCETARYHIVKHRGNLANITNFSGHTDGHRTNNKRHYLYETTYFTRGELGPLLYWHYSPVNNLKPIRLAHSSIYKTSRFNVMPEKNITDILEERKDFSHTESITKIAQMNEKVFTKEAPKNLYLVTTDDGWIDPRSRTLGKVMISPELARYEGLPALAENFARLNHVPLYLWGGDIGYFQKNSVHRFRSSAGIDLIFWMDNKGVMRIGYDGLPRNEWPKVVQFNIPARDGIIWALDGYLRCPDSLCAMQLEDKDTYTFFTAACLTTDLEGEVDVKKAFANRPTEIAKRHPDQCVVIKQGEIETVKDIFEDAPSHGH